MVSRLRALTMKLAFDGRQYELGDTIDVSVDISPKSDIDVREGRVELKCDMRYTEATAVMVRPRGGGGRGGAVIASPAVAKQVTAEHEETYTQSSVVFLQDTQLRSGTASAYKVRLGIPKELPANVAGSSTRGRARLKWSVVASVDIARARDVTASRAVRVLGLSSSRKAGGSKLTPEQRSENARKAARARWAKALFSTRFFASYYVLP